jgi:hypothetical protein
MKVEGVACYSHSVPNIAVGYTFANATNNIAFGVAMANATAIKNCDSYYRNENLVCEIPTSIKDSSKDIIRDYVVSECLSNNKNAEHSCTLLSSQISSDQEKFGDNFKGMQV